jgi:AraC-like DNA-binding protein
MEKETRINGHDVSEAHLQIYAEDTELLFSAGPNILWKAFGVDRDFLQSAALAHLGRPLKLPDSGFVNLVPDPFLLVRLERLTERCFQDLQRRPELAPKWRTQLTTAYIEALASTDSEHADRVHRRAKRRSEVLRRADSYLRARIGEAYSSRELCQHLGMTERSLQIHFKEEVGMSPQKWFRQLALHRAFEILKGGEGKDGAVTAAALACGFDHLGRFSQSYRQIFNELPSETARNRG